MTAAASVFREDSALWDLLLGGSLLFLLGVLLAVALDFRDEMRRR